MTKDTRTLRRIAAAILLPLGPLLIAILRGILPYSTNDDSATLIDRTAAGIGRQDAVIWLGLAAALTLVPGALAAARLAQRRAPRLALAGVALLVPAFIALPLMANDVVIRIVAGEGVDRATAVRLLDAANGLGPVLAATVLFVLGHIAGLILLGVALWRAGAVPAWAGLAIIVSQPLHLVFAVIVPNPLLDAAAWGLTAIGLGVAGLRVLRTANDDWDVSFR